MTIVYSWTTDSDEDAENSVIVDIRGDAVKLPSGETQYENVCAFIYWSEKVNNLRVLNTVLDGPYSVMKALRRAETLRLVWQYESVALWMPHRSIWRDEWGELRALEGIAPPNFGDE